MWPTFHKNKYVDYVTLSSTARFLYTVTRNLGGQIWVQSELDWNWNLGSLKLWGFFSFHKGSETEATQIEVVKISGMIRLSSGTLPFKKQKC